MRHLPLRSRRGTGVPEDFPSGTVIVKEWASERTEGSSLLKGSVADVEWRWRPGQTHDEGDDPCERVGKTGSVSNLQWRRRSFGRSVGVSGVESPDVPTYTLGEEVPDTRPKTEEAPST